MPAAGAGNSWPPRNPWPAAPIDAFMRNADWAAVAERMAAVRADRPLPAEGAYGFHVGCNITRTLRERGFGARYVRGGVSAWYAAGGGRALRSAGG